MNWQEQARQAKSKPPDWVLHSLQLLELPLTGEYQNVHSWQWRYALDGAVFIINRLPFASGQPGTLYGPWVVYERMCGACGQVFLSGKLTSLADVGTALDAPLPDHVCRG
jgi:hypothetical protein